MNNTAQIINLFDQQIEQNQQIKTDKVDYVKADTENGFMMLANEISLYLVKQDLTGRQFRVAFSVIIKTYGFNKKHDWISASQIAELMEYKGAETHLSADVRMLIKRNILQETGKKIGPNPVVSEWIKTKIPTKTTDRKQSANKPKTVTALTENGHQTDRNQSTQKKDNIKNNNKDTYVVSDETIKDLFNETSGLSKIIKISAARKKAIKARSKDLKTIEHWEDFFFRVAQSNFLTGKSSDWQANFDWILKEANFIKILEGNYDNRTPQHALAPQDDNWHQDLGL